LAKESNTLVLPANVADVGSMIALAMQAIRTGQPEAPRAR
jgi:SPFH domain/Band 7 family protein